MHSICIINLCLFINILWIIIKLDFQYQAWTLALNQLEL